MDGEPVAASPSWPVCYGSVFEKLCGRYLAMGMSCRDYWDGDCTMAKYYREADELRRDRENFSAWLQGLYTYQAVNAASPVLNPMNKRRTPYKYLDAPVPLTRGAEKRAQEEKERENLEKGKRFMEAMRADINARFQKKGGKTDGG